MVIPVSSALKYRGELLRFNVWLYFSHIIRVDALVERLVVNLSMSHLSKVRNGFVCLFCSLKPAKVCWALEEIITESFVWRWWLTKNRSMVCLLSTKVKEISTIELKDKSRVASSGSMLRDQKQSIHRVLVVELRANSFAIGSYNFLKLKEL